LRGEDGADGDLVLVFAVQGADVEDGVDGFPDPVRRVRMSAARGSSSSSVGSSAVFIAGMIVAVLFLRVFAPWRG
jgi:hypothetical protein